MQPEALRRSATAALSLACFAWSTPGFSGDARAETAKPESRGYGTKRESEPPRYVHTLSDTGIAALRGVDWLDFGADFRFRFELRDNDFRRDREALDLPILLRTRAYLGLRELVDPLRFAVEIEDARIANTLFEETDRDVNTVEPIQLYGELYFRDLLGRGTPVVVRGGRVAFELLDRRLVARNEWRNTTNTFQGVQLSLGERRSEVQAELFALQPLDRAMHELDAPHPGQWFFGAVGALRSWSELFTLEPYAMRLRQERTADDAPRDVQHLGLRSFGVVGDTGLDFDAHLAGQLGVVDGRDHAAAGMVLEGGYTLPHRTKTRLSAQYGYGSGDASPGDRRSGRFDRFYGFARPWSNDDYMQWENLHSAKLRVEMWPAKWLQADAGLNAYWLASATDRWNAAGLRDEAGESGSFIGHELDARVILRPASRVALNLGYAYFRAGEFTRNAGRAGSSNFGYAELSLSAL